MTGEALRRLREGGKRALADALARIEAAPTASATVDLLDQAYHGPLGHVVGVTGPPGVGKSTLIAAMIRAFRAEGRTVGVIAIDPSSRRSGGSLLGDRVRIDTDPADQKVFFRSMAARDRLGGLAAITSPAVVLMRAVFDRVIVETVGVGQSETDIAAVADTVVLCVQPGSGDSLQYMKAGIAEIPDIAVVTKADLGAVARQTQRDLRAALTTTGQATGEPGRPVWQVPVLSVASDDKTGVVSLIAMIDKHRGQMSSTALDERRRQQAQRWLIDALKDAYGRKGVRIIERLSGEVGPAADESPFCRLRDLESTLRERFPAE